MTGAIALAIVLLIGVVGVSMALQGQRNVQSPQGERPTRVIRPRPQQPRRPRERDQPRERKVQPQADAPPRPTPPSDSEPKGPELLRTGVAADAKVMSVVDERKTGPVTRSRLTLQIEPSDGRQFEVTVRVAFPTPEARSNVKVGGSIPVRYDKDDRTRVVVDIPQG